MLDVLHEMIDKVYEIGMVYGITVIIYLLEGYLLAGFAAQFGDMRWKIRGGRFLFAFFWMLQYEFISFPGVGHAGLNLLLARLKLYIRMFIMLKLFFVIRRDKLLFVTVMYEFLNGITTLIAGIIPGIVGDFHPEILAQQFTGIIRHNRETAHLLTMLFGIGGGILQEVVLFMVIAFGIRLIAGGIADKKAPLHFGELCFLLIPAVATNIACIIIRYVRLVTRDTNSTPYESLYDRFPELQPLIIALGVLLAVVTIADVYVFRDIVKSNKERAERVILRRQADELKQHLLEISDKNERIRSIRHDMKNHIAVLTGLLEDVKGHEELKAYVQKLDRDVGAADSGFSTGNVVMDALLSVKYREISGRLRECRFDTDALLFPQDLEISDFDLAVLLGNALDNALEACEKEQKADQTAELFIALSSQRKGSMLLLEVKNSYLEPLRIDKNAEFPRTDKEDEEGHGIGYRNMKAVAEKYQGAIEWQAKDGVFVLSVMLQNISHP
ncbi:MAG: GHKL domain-containing protein [Lachnospiraceae bacterium]|nr:GHKL domain-containing protein [Lachnospiraceae bacterium]